LKDLTGALRLRLSATARRLNSAARTAAAFGLCNEESIAETEPLHLPLDVLPTQAWNAQEHLVLREQMRE
jgi:hypothetical protein